QFSADGFFIGRLIVGFEKDLTYDVQAEGRSVVIRTGAPPGSGVERALPPPVAPVDRAAAERFENARKEAEAAAGKAAVERKNAENMAAHAREQQAEAQRLAQQAERVRKEAEGARREAETLRVKAQEAIARDRATAEEAARQAENRLRDLQVSAQAIAASRAEAERLAAQAEQARRDAEETAARAEAQHKVRLAELEEQTARAQKEKRAAEAARERADAARRDAERAQEAAEQARQEAERSRALTTAKLTEITERERQARAAIDKLQSERQAIEAKREQVEAQKQAVESQRREVETRRLKLESEEQALATSRRELESRRRTTDERSQGIDAKEQKVEAERKRLADMQKSIEATQERLAKEREQITALKKRVEAAASKAAENAKQEKTAESMEPPPVIASERAGQSLPVESLVASPGAKVQVASATVTSPGVAVESGSSAARPRARLTGIKRRGSGAQAAVLLALDGSPTYEVQRLEDPPRLVIDLADTVREVSRTTYGVKSPFVARVRLGDHGSVVRAVIDLTAAASEHDIQATPEGLLIRMQAPPPATMARAAASKPASETTAAPVLAKPPAPAPPAGEQSTLRDVRFKRVGDTASVILEIPQAPIARVDDRSRRAWVLELRGARIPKDLERSLDTTAYGTVVRLVSTYQASTDPPIVNVVANLEGPASYDLRRESGTLVWEIRSSGAPAAGGPVAASSFTTEATALAGAAPQQGKARKRISIDLKDAEIVNVIRLIAEEAGENIITGDDVSGKVTLKLRNVPWDQALDTILKSKGYGTVREHNIMRIAPLEKIQRERELQLARKKAEEQVEEPTIKMITVNYASAAELVPRLKPLLSVRGSIEVDTRTNTLIVDDIRNTVNRIVELTRRLDKQTPQVLIEARIVEATSSNLRDLGVQWGGVGQATARTGNPTGLQFPGDVRAA
ncbi:MAG: AMIN domain-containing protein, partial [Deltaproteobacteria bacterium]|nr:AMIN domain-containing protein [Deltaproteobacteria bacterium]